MMPNGSIPKPSPVSMPSCQITAMTEQDSGMSESQSERV